MRYPIPFGSSTKILDTGGLRNGVVLFNSGTVDVFVDPQQILLDQTDPVSGIPQNGIKIAAGGTQPTVIPFYVGQLYARCAAQQGALDVWPYCADC